MELNEFEKSLMNLAPVEAELDPAAAAYQAGFRQGRSSTRKWQISSGCMTLMVILLAFFNISGSQNQPYNYADINGSSIQITSSDVEIKADYNRIKLQLNELENNVQKLNDNSYLLLRRRVLDKGLDALPESTGSNGKVYTLKDMLNS